jgi:hypothetical protein
VNARVFQAFHPQADSFCSAVRVCFQPDRDVNAIKDLPYRLTHLRFSTINLTKFEMLLSYKKNPVNGMYESTVSAKKKYSLSGPETVLSHNFQSMIILQLYGSCAAAN